MQYLASILYILLITLHDCYFYGVLYEKRQSNFFLVRPLWHYRIYQKLVEIAGLVFLFYLFESWPQIIGLLLAHYFMTFDRLYYVFMRQEYLIKEYETHIHAPFWLSYPWQFGFVMWKLNPGAKGNNYSAMTFTGSALLGLAVALLLNII